MSVVLSAIIATAFAFMLTATHSLNDTAVQARQSQQVLVAANQLELQILNVETGLRGYIISRDPTFLQPFQTGRSAFPGMASELERVAASSSPAQGARARQLAAAGASYINDYSVPLLATAQRNPAAARTALRSQEGKQRVDTIRNQAIQLETAENQLLAAHQASASAAATRAVWTAAAAIPASIGFILLAGGYLALRVVGPVRRASVLAGQVAQGDLAVRMPEDAPGEVGVLERALNKMTHSLSANRDELRQTAEEQAALRRVATLVASGAAQTEVFDAVAAETGPVVAAERAAVVRYEPGRSVTVVGTWGRPGSPGPALGSNWAVMEKSNLGLVLSTHAPTRVTSYPDVPGELSAWAAHQGVRWTVGTPITVEGAIWGLAIVFSGHGEPPVRAEERILGFTELAAMAVSNADNRAKLTASRVRLVAAADDARRRVERDLHDGAQQRLITLALEMRAAAERLPPEDDWIAEEWAHATKELRDVTDELREISRGLHPVALEKGGLPPALRALVRRCSVKAELNVDLGGRLPERVEAAGYYVVSEALTNVVKHAGASVVRIKASAADGALRLTVTDDGAGGADPAHGSGLVGLSDRVEALGGRIKITSPPGGGTSLEATIPLSAG